MVEIGGSSGISTIALAAAARETQGRLTSIEIEPSRQAESRETLTRLGLDKFVDYLCDDARNILPSLGEVDFATPAHVNVDVKPVAGEVNVTNNKASYPVLFSLG